MTADNKKKPPRPEVIVEPAASGRRTPENEGLRKGATYSYVYYGPKKGRLSSVKLALGLAVLMAGLFVIVVLGGLIFLGLFAVLVVVAAISRIFSRK